ncbi:hypothetical protein NQ036_03615 [Brevibacterium sp. 91QC2O2]|uniref:hypothetical protein n=1 Tax=Brevibacterium TaxID=1696 RepID=UPI00211C0E0B|nr:MULTISPECIES: hypothetical protein [unclassified Brevibacterium]MCQ9367334.1 hypothetical protein [Brevibacterium sp. 91QC2O2]MCQ9384653.1 hypothetical protein [Brevibacterium sp. 68QC2CO]
MIPKPIVSLHGSGESVTLDPRAGDFVLMQGSTGLGWGPQELTTAALPGGGSVLRHRRTAEADVVVPFLLSDRDYYVRRDHRRRLERLFDDRVEIRVTHPDGLVRSRYGYYADGLQGAYGSGEDSHDGQKLSLTIRCVDPWWYGAARGERFQVKTRRKPFITGVSGDAVRINRQPNGGFEHATADPWTFGGADAQAWAYDSAEHVSGSRSVRVTSAEGSGTPHILTPQASSGGLAGFGIPAYGLQVKASAGITHLRMQIWHLSTSTPPVWRPIGPNPTFKASTDWQRLDIAALTNPGGGQLALQVQALRSVGGQLRDVPAGESFWIDEVIEEATGRAGAFFDGDTTAPGRAYTWVSGPGSTAQEEAKSQTGALPFFPIRLSGSTVQGTYRMTVAGDLPAYGVATVTGPGRDVTITNQATGEQILIAGDITDPIIIDSRPGSYDVTSQGQDIWDRVTGEPSILVMNPGQVEFSIAMVDATAASTVEITYQETWKAGM